MGKSFGLQMAKASPDDIAGGFDLAVILDALDKGYYPSYFATPEDREAAEETGIPTFFDDDDMDHLRHLHELIVDLLRRRPGFSLWRIVMGMDVILRNDILDPNADHLAIHPKFEALAQERQQLRAALADLVGSGDVDKLRGMEVAIRELPAPAEDRAISINAIHALIATAPSQPVKAEGAQRCEGGSPECGPVEHYDNEGIPLCSKCWQTLLEDSTHQEPDHD
ncbi:MAG: hypothetical protein ACYC0F_05345 [Rhodanobacter sp.]